ncbi:L-seryl-tRNA(Sec) selenium transferase [Alkalicoccus urumqiensis]|uniref:L-seryl-tRNA(Sec) selenium transferase n=1 Tax=Alkalicoccus urumqiensis TaxID=1548213 RepID=A0A2P6MDW0_ALKUR|nr:L-seryl-tRNA(Sec) selenium transferase [Alkalicoccus urumqiensis]
MTEKQQRSLRLLPAVHELKSTSFFTHALESAGWTEAYTVEILRTLLENMRAAILEGHLVLETEAEAQTELVKRLEHASVSPYHLQKVINATGTVLHTNLGRARLGKKAAEHVYETAVNYSNLEYNLSEGKRGSRTDILERLLQEVTGAEAAVAVNNNAAAVYFVLKALAADKEVIVSRGELVEIGGSFRVSSIMEESGAVLVETGTTNKTRASDYTRPLGPDTAMAMKVHTSNFAVVGFTEETDTPEIKRALEDEGREDVIVYEDLGSGSIYPFASENIGSEPLVRKAVKHADLVSFSGDKLLGGPQAGIIAGKKEWIDKLKKHQLARVLRLDKMTLAALEATLWEYAYGTPEEIPAVRDIIKSEKELEQTALKRAGEIAPPFTAAVKSAVSKVGGGTMPLVERPTSVLELHHPGCGPEEIEKYLRSSSPPVIGRISKGEFLLDMRTVNEEDWALIRQALARFK